MKRRQLLGGLGALTASATLSVGAGAFSSVDASRKVAVTVAGDNDALLALEERGGLKSVERGTPEQVVFRFPSMKQRNEYLREDGDSLGLGTRSVYEFAADDGNGLLRIENQGTQTVTVYSAFDSRHSLDIELFDVSDPDYAALRNEPAELGVGEHVDVGFRIDTHGSSVGRFDETLTIVAEVPR